MMALLLAVTALTACTKNVDDEPQSMSSDDIYLSVVRDMYPDESAEFTDSELLELGNAVCSDLDNGSTFYDIALIFLSQDEPWPTIGGGVTGAAVASFCPEYTDEMEAFTDSLAG